MVELLCRICLKRCLAIVIVARRYIKCIFDDSYCQSSVECWMINKVSTQRYLTLNARVIMTASRMVVGNFENGIFWTPASMFSVVVTRGCESPQQ